MLAFACVACALMPVAHAAGSTDGVGRTFLWLAIILLAAKVCSSLAERVRLPGVLGELIIGVVLGNLGLAGVHGLDRAAADPILGFIAELGVVVLLFQIGLETKLSDMAKVGVHALLVAVVGVIAPFALGTYVVGPWLLPGHSSGAYLFLGAALTATSVGITARVFRDLGQLQSREAQIVLGAAVIDDVMGLVILAVVTGLVREGAVSGFEVVRIIVEAVVFLAAAIFIGRFTAPWILKFFARVDARIGMKLTVLVSIGLLLAWLAHAVGLAPIVGAFAAGLFLEPVFLHDFNPPPIVHDVRPLLRDVPPPASTSINAALDRYAEHHHEDLVEHLGYFFVPVFFVVTGMQVDLRSFADPTVLGIALAITVVAFVGKLIAGAVAGRGVNRWLVGWGMAPRGEVGLIFAMVGKQLGVVDETMFSVVVIMVILTTLLTPPVLVQLFRRSARAA
ncbi:MAG TPA: cation:proton antiporter [Burkholderiales bacterium]|nr:cation:proton antiporter [Burkholderiales bacterium]